MSGLGVVQYSIYNDKTTELQIGSSKTRGCASQSRCLWGCFSVRWDFKAVYGAGTTTGRQRVQLWPRFGLVRQFASRKLPRFSAQLVISESLVCLRVLHLVILVPNMFPPLLSKIAVHRRRRIN